MCEYSTGLGNLVHATVTGLPADTLGPAEVTEMPKAGEVLPPHTSTSQDFGEEVGLVYASISRVEVKELASTNCTVVFVLCHMLPFELFFVYLH